VKKVNKKSPALREKSPALLCIFSSQTAHSPQHYPRNAPITKIVFENKGVDPGNLEILCTYRKSEARTAKVKLSYIFQMVID